MPPRESHELNEKCFSGLMRDKPGGQIIDHGYDASLRAHPLHARIDSMPSTTTAAPGASEQKWLNGGGHAVMFVMSGWLVRPVTVRELASGEDRVHTVI